MISKNFKYSKKNLKLDAITYNKTILPEINIEILHVLGQEEAFRRTKRLLEATIPTLPKQISSLKINWIRDGGYFHFKAMNFTINGNVRIDSTSLKISSNLPIVFLPIRGQIASTICEAINSMLKHK